MVRPPPPWTLGALYACSEIVLAFARRSKSVDRARDRNSLTILWTAIVLGVAASIIATDKLRSAAFGHRWASWLGLALFAAGLLLRWYSIVHLGRFFTVDVKISAGHKVIDSGPYRVVRHPSYSGALLAFVGFGLYLHNWAALLVLLVPITAAFLWRIQVEERVLIDALGNEYRRYASRTNRLIPSVY
jgi:protein-S-isoprenylcysteine O-methyltransferase Ste14